MLVQLPKLICCAKFSLGQFYVAKTRSNGKICFRASFGKHNKGFAKRRQNKRMLHQNSFFFLIETPSDAERSHNKKWCT